MDGVEGRTEGAEVDEVEQRYHEVEVWMGWREGCAVGWDECGGGWWDEIVYHCIKT